MKKGLGKGLAALIEEAQTSIDNTLTHLKINEIEPNRNQPRKYFDDEKLKQLAESIKEHGIVQPIIVKIDNEVYRIVAGERRWRAARIAGLTEVPVIVKDITNKQVMEIALIENIQREDLNPIEEAEAYDRLIREYNMTQDELSNTIGKSRPVISNTIRLLALCEAVKQFVISGQISNGHARALIVISDDVKQLEIARIIIEKNLNVRDTEKLVKNINIEKQEKRVKEKNENFSYIEDKLKNLLGTKVELIANNKKGKILIEYYSNDELDRIIEMLDRLG